VSGNPSARMPGNPELVLIKATGKCFGEVNAEDFVLVDLAGNLVSGSGKPSKEVKFHCGIYRERPEAGAVFHGHSAHTTAYVAAKGDLPLVTAASRALIGRVGVVDFAPAGSDALAALVIDAFKGTDLKCCVLKNHGFVTVAADIAKAFYMGDVLEDNAKVAGIMASYK
jgi:L-fuculose-phosphate aldolase